MSNSEAARRQAADLARQSKPAPVYTPATPSVIREAGTGAYNATASAQPSSSGKK